MDRSDSAASDLRANAGQVKIETWTPEPHERELALLRDVYALESRARPELGTALEAS